MRLGLVLRRAWPYVLMAIAIALIVFNYGVTNLTLEVVGIEIPVVYTVLAIVFAAIILSDLNDALVALREPTSLAIVGLAILALSHLVVEIPKHGLWALRDTSFVVDATLLVVGAVMAKRFPHRRVVARILIFVFVLNLLYSMTFPFGEHLREVSPQAGVFRDDVAVFGYYANSALYLIAGALFLTVVVRRNSLNPLGSLALAGVQGGLSFLFQWRSLYLAIGALIFLVAVLQGWRKTLRVVVAFPLAMLALLLLATMTGVKLDGRLGPFSLPFTLNHVVTLVPGIEVSADVELVREPSSNGQDRDIPEQTGDNANTSTTDEAKRGSETPPPKDSEPSREDEATAIAQNSTQWRLDVWREAIEQWSQSPGQVVWGVGFGDLLTDVRTKQSVPIRQPHNIHISLLVRMGILGFALWVFLNGRIAYVFLRAATCQSSDEASREYVVWFFLFYILGMVYASLQAWLEFTHGAVPYFLIVGYGFHVARKLTKQGGIE